MEATMIGDYRFLPSIFHSEMPPSCICSYILLLVVCWKGVLW